MATSNDFLLTAEGDLEIQNGDFVVAPCDNQNVLDIIVSFAGWWREYPTCGVGIQNYQSSAGQQQALESAIRLQLRNDGFQVGNIQAIPDGNNFVITANASRNI